MSLCNFAIAYGPRRIRCRGPSTKIEKLVLSPVLPFRGSVPRFSSPWRCILGRWPVAFFLLYRALNSGNRLQRPVRRDTDLVIEGFPRCANTFAVLAFRYLQARDTHVASHVHSAAQVLRASAWGIPTIVLLRDPIDAVVSLVVRHPEITLDSALRSYNCFYGSIRGCRDSFVAATFDQVTSQFAEVILATNRRFGTRFVARPLSESDIQSLFSQIDRHAAKTGQTELQTSRPSDSRGEIATMLRNQLHGAEYRALVREATGHYDALRLHDYSHR